MIARRILIVDTNAGFRSSLTTILETLGHEVVHADARPDDERVRAEAANFDIVIGVGHDEIETFRLDASMFASRSHEREGLPRVVEETLLCEMRFARDSPASRGERIELALPSDVRLMNPVVHYLVERAARGGSVPDDRPNLYVALDEAFVNACIHGNKSDPTKLVRVTAELARGEARFTIEDEGAGFDRASVPDPLDPANLFKTSGRGVLLIHNIMDAVEYNEAGNRVTMTKRRDDVLQSRLVERLAPTKAGRHE